MSAKLFYSITASVFVVAFTSSAITLEIVKPEFVHKTSAARRSRRADPEVDHGKAIGYSLAIAVGATAIAAIAASASTDYKLGTVPHSAVAALGTVAIVYAVIAIAQPKFLRREDGRDINHLMTGLFAGLLGIVVGGVDVAVMRQINKPDFSAPSASCFPEMGFSNKTHYKMSFPSCTVGCGN